VIKLTLVAIRIAAYASLATDSVYVYDGDSAKPASLIATLSGVITGVLPSYMSSQRYMFVRFTSGGNSTGYKGFNMTYYSTTSGSLYCQGYGLAGTHEVHHSLDFWLDSASSDPLPMTAAFKYSTSRCCFSVYSSFEIEI